MIIFIYIILLILSFYRKKSKAVYIFNLIFMWLVATFCYGIADEAIYQSRYANPEIWNGITEVGFNTLINLCRIFKLDYIGFKGVVYAICLICIGSTVYKFSKYPNIILMLYFVCPFPLNVAQIRNFIANAIMIFSFRYIMEDTRSKNIFWKLNSNDLKFCIGILAATTVHTAALLWLVLLIAKKLDTKKNYWVMLMMNILFMFVITPSSLSRIASMFGSGGRINAYFSLEYAQSEWKHYGPIVSVLIAAFFSIGIARYLRRRKVKNQQDLILCEKINVSSLGLVSMMVRYTSEIKRIQEGISIINYMLITNAIDENIFKLSRISKKNLSIIIMLIVFLIIYTVLILTMYLNESVWNTFWFNNSFFSFL